MHDSTNTWRSWTSTLAFGWACRDDRNLTNTYVAQQPGQLMKNIHHALAASSNEQTASLCATCNMRDRLLWYSWVHMALRPVTSRAVSAFNWKRHTQAYLGVTEAFEWTLDRHTLPLWSRDVATGDSRCDINFRVYFMRSVSRSDIAPVQCGRVILIATAVS